VRADRLVFERALQALNEDVVHAPTSTVNLDRDSGHLRAPGEGEACELAAVVGVEDVGAAVALYGFGQRHCAEAGVEGVGEAPGEHPRVAQSMMATRYRNPRWTGMWV